MSKKQVGSAPSNTDDIVSKGYVDSTVTSAVGSAIVPVSRISATGTAGSTTYLRGDGSWNTPTGISTGKAIAMAMVFG